MNSNSLTTEEFHGKNMNYPAIFTLKRGDGLEKIVKFKEDEPGWVLIKGTGISNGQCTPKLEEHDRLEIPTSISHWGLHEV